MRVFPFFCLFALLCVSLLRVQPAHAGELCGYVPEKEVRHVYDLAKDIRVFLDIKEDIRVFCSRIGSIKKRDKYWFRNKAQAAFMKERTASIQDVIADFRVLSIPLATIKDWIRIVPRDKKDKLRRMVSIKRARMEALLYMEYLGEDIEFLDTLIKTDPALFK